MVGSTPSGTKRVFYGAKKILRNTIALFGRFQQVNFPYFTSKYHRQGSWLLI